MAEKCFGSVFFNGYDGISYYFILNENITSDAALGIIANSDGVIESFYSKGKVVGAEEYAEFEQSSNCKFSIEYSISNDYATLYVINNEKGGLTDIERTDDKIRIKKVELSDYIKKKNVVEHSEKGSLPFPEVDWMKLTNDEWDEAIIFARQICNEFDNDNVRFEPYRIKGRNPERGLSFRVFDDDGMFCGQINCTEKNTLKDMKESILKLREWACTKAGYDPRIKPTEGVFIPVDVVNRMDLDFVISQLELLRVNSEELSVENPGECVYVKDIKALDKSIDILNEIKVGLEDTKELENNLVKRHKGR